MKIILAEPYPLIAPIPASVIAVSSEKSGDNLITLAWIGVACSEPPCISIAIRRDHRHSYHIIHENPEFTVNIAQKENTRAVDSCGVLHGNKIDKWSVSGLTKDRASIISVPIIREFPINLECRVIESLILGSHELFIGEVVATHVNEDVFIDGSLKMELFSPPAYIPKIGKYFALENKSPLGRYGFSKK
ncbi:flavin reductase family protein [bacterium]|nr:flavin reductase family protein [bacterium]